MESNTPLDLNMKDPQKSGSRSLELQPRVSQKGVNLGHNMPLVWV